MRNKLAKLLLVPIFTLSGAVAASEQSANGHGTLLVLNEEGDPVRRQFSFSAGVHADGTVKGQAILHNPAFQVEGQNYQLKISISCLQVIENIAFLGGTTTRTNDPSLVDAVFFSVQDVAEPGRERDKISSVFFWDDDPTTTGNPQACLLNQVGDFPMNTIESGNIQVRN